MLHGVPCFSNLQEHLNKLAPEGQHDHHVIKKKIGEEWIRIAKVFLLV
jgi:hypothetical protein